VKPTRFGRGLNLVGRLQAGSRAVLHPDTATSAAEGATPAAPQPATPPAPEPDAPAAPEDGRPDDAPTRFPIGHFYSPAYDPRELAEEPRRSQIWPPEPRPTPEIDWREQEQIELCRGPFAAQDRLELATREPSDPTEYYTSNDQFPALDAWALEAIVRHRRPHRMIEVGSGFSSLVTARVNREHLDGRLEFTCIEPYPRPFLVEGVPGISKLRVEKVQDTPLEVFDSLGRGDVLFIDTSHTVKTGGDVTWIYHEIIPRLASGVAVHMHDICLPGDYPPSWVLEGWGWNETYLVRAFLSFNDEFHVLFSSPFMVQRHPDVLLEAFPGFAEHRRNAGSSLWIERR
jgi:Methyltransferase domain